MDWNRLVCDKRLGLEEVHDPRRGGTRTDFRRDFDRLVFSSPFRRLQNKTQVFPLPGSIFVHNRLTHSMEVACVGKSLADGIAQTLRQRHPEMAATTFDSISDIVSAACLAHDLGNPPFGHSGEKAISTFFSEGEGRVLRGMLDDRQWADFTNFEGNANAFRVLTHQFKGRRRGGFAMTYSTLASIVKYPYESTLAAGKGKFGFFASEEADFCRVADELGMLRLDGPAVSYARHPFVYIVEAADDICYEVMDIEDAHKLRILTTQEVIDAFMSFFPEEERARMSTIMARVSDPNEKIAYLRSCVVGTLVSGCVDAFLDNEQALLDGAMQGTLVRGLDPLRSQAYGRCNDLSWDKIYNSGDVVDIELAGNRIITSLLSKLTHAVLNPDLNYSRLLLAKFPDQYDTGAPTPYGRIQAVLDHVSAMTDVYALDLYRKLNGTSLSIVN